MFLSQREKKRVPVVRSAIEKGGRSRNRVGGYRHMYVRRGHRDWKNNDQGSGLCTAESVKGVQRLGTAAVGMDAITLVDYVYQVGNELVKRCKLVKQCHCEATSIAIRTLNALGTLEEASAEFSGSVWFDASLIELKRALHEADDLVKVSCACCCRSSHAIYLQVRNSTSCSLRSSPSAIISALATAVAVSDLVTAVSALTICD